MAAVARYRTICLVFAFNVPILHPGYIGTIVNVADSRFLYDKYFLHHMSFENTINNIRKKQYSK